MGYVYLSIEKNVEVFELYKALWKAHGIEGIRVDTMTEGIKKAIEIEKSGTSGLFFIDVAADDIDFMPQLKILSEETSAPIFIATTNPDDDEHHEALNNGADFYGKYCKEPGQNIDGVFSAINSINRRTKKQKAPNGIISHGDILIDANRHKAFIKDKELSLTGTEMKILHYLMVNRGNVLQHGQICRKIYDDDGGTFDSLYSAIKRLRKKILAAAQADYIETVRGVGYRLTTKGG